jgi:hypothetical protein
MTAMVGKRLCQIKVPRLDAYAALSWQQHEPASWGTVILCPMRCLFPFPFNAFTAASRLPPAPADFMTLTAA